jgi:hypothetical protein
MIVSAAWIVPAVFAVINRIAQARLQGWEPATFRELLFEFGDWLLYAFLTPGVFVISKKWTLTRPHLVRRAVLHFFFSLLFCVAWATCGQVLRLILVRVFAPHLFHAAMQEGMPKFLVQVGVEWLSWIFTTLPFGVAVYLCVVGIEHATRYFIDARDREVQVHDSLSNYPARASPRSRRNSIRIFSSTHSTRSRCSFVTTIDRARSASSNTSASCCDARCHAIVQTK